MHSSIPGITIPTTASTAAGSGLTLSTAGTAISILATAISASHAITASYALNGGTGGGPSESSSYASTASYSISSSYSPTTIPSDLTVDSLTANNFVLAQNISVDTIDAYNNAEIQFVTNVNLGSNNITASRLNGTSSFAISSSYAPTSIPSDLTVDSVTANNFVLTTNISVDTIDAYNNSEIQFVANVNLGSSNITASRLKGTASYADFAKTASYALNGGSGGTQIGTGSTFPFTSSWAVSASYAMNGGGGSGTQIGTGSTFPFTSSWAVTASYALAGGTGGAAAATASWAYVWLPAGAMVGRTTLGSVYTVLEFDSGSTNTNAICQAFDAAIQEGAVTQIQMPPNWDWSRGLQARFNSTRWNGTETGSVVFGIAAKAIRSGSYFTGSYGTEVSASSTFTSRSLSVSPTTNLFTVAGIASANDMIGLQVQRKVSDTADTFASDAYLVGVLLQYQETASAWSTI